MVEYPLFTYVDSYKTGYIKLNTLIYNEATLYVTEAAAQRCKEINPWRNFKVIKTYQPSGIKDVKADTDATQPAFFYNLNGMEMSNEESVLAPGIYIKKQGDKSTKVLVK